MPNVLIVDDSEDSAKLLAYDLHDMGYNVSTAFSGDECITTAANHSPDIILLDMRMPGLSGLDTLANLKRLSETEDIPVIMISASSADDSVVKALDMGADDYVSKPVVLPVLTARMRASLRLRSATEQLEKANEELTRLATTDPLTHLYNRRHFFALGYAEFTKSLRHKRPLSFILLDVDKFKNINDTYGHSAGDHALIVLADCCREAVRESDIIGRIGGEEFAICCPDSDLGGAHAIAERIRSLCECQLIQGAEYEFSFTVSLGITTRQSLDDQFERLFNRADRLLYQAKESGRNQAIAN